MRSCPHCSRLYDDAFEFCPEDGALLSAPDEFLGRVIEGKYRIEALLGAGAMGAVYRATQLALDRAVALKVIKRSIVADKASVVRFKREALVVARLRHPHIVTIHDFGMIRDGGAFIVMELVDGRSMSAELAERRRLPVGEAILLMRQVCDAVEEAHSCGIIHRDLKPHNIVIETARDGPRAKVLDFGIAKLRSHAEQVAGSVTETGVLLGTPLYMSPEQCVGEEVDARSDVYSLGCVLYELLTGRPPFLVSNLRQLLARQIAERPVPPSAYAEDIPPAMDAVVLEALEKEPIDRFQSAADFAVALALARNTSQAVPATPGPDQIRVLDAIVARQSGRGALPPLVGRTREVEVLSGHLERALAGECQLVLLKGEAGTGKSRLLDELEVLAARRGVRTIRARFAEVEQALPYQGFLDAIHDYARSRADGGAPLADLAPELVAIFPSLKEHDGFLGADREPRQAVDRTTIHETLAATITRMAAGKPLVICAEDLQGADVSAEALAYLARRLVWQPLLIVGAYRSEEVDRRHAVARLIAAFEGERRFALTELGPLGIEDVTSLIAWQLGGGTLAGDLAHRVHETADGNPYFTREIVRSMVETGALTKDESGIWGMTTGADLAPDALPKTMRDVVLRRVGHLGVEARELLSTAAVLGKRFHLDDLRLLVAAGQGLDELVDRLVEGGLLVEDRHARGDWLEFASAAMREVLYGVSTARKRRALHRHFASALEERDAERLDRVLPALVHHYAAGDVPTKVVEHGLRLARLALHAWSGADACRTLERVLEFVDDVEPAREAEARELLAEAWHMEGNPTRALDELEAAARTWERVGDPERAVQAMARAAEAAWEARDVEAANRWVEVGLAECEGHDSALASGIRRRLSSLGATLANLAGDHDIAAEYLRDAAPEQLDGRPDGDAGGRDLAASQRTTANRSAGPGSIAPEGNHARSRADARSMAHVAMRFVHSQLDPCLVRNTSDAEVTSLVFEPLLRVGESMRIEPWLAEAVSVDNSGTRYSFRLRDGVRFHDGRPLTSADVRFTLERMLASEGESRWMFEPIAGASEILHGEARELSGFHVVSASEFHIDLKRPLACFPAMLTYVPAWILPKGTERLEGSWREGCVGTGPFRLTRATPGSRVEMEANPDYWRRGYPRCGGVTFEFGVADEELLARARSERHAMAWYVPLQTVETLRRDHSTAHGLRDCLILGTSFVAFNTRRGPLQEEATRHRLVDALSSDRFAAGTSTHATVLARGLIPPGLLGYEPVRRKQARSVDASVAANAVELTCAIPPLVRQTTGSALLEALDEQGFRVRVVNDTWEECEAARQSATVDLLVWAWNCDYPDADSMVHGVLHSEAGVIGRFVGSPELDRLCEQGRSESSPEARRRLYRQIEDTIASRALLLPLSHNKFFCHFGAGIEGAELNIFQPRVSYEKLVLRASSAYSVSPALKPPRPPTSLR